MPTDPLPPQSTPSLVGIDLGTTHSLCAVFTGGAPRLIPNAHGAFLTPSVVGVLPRERGRGDERVVVGQTARELALTSPERTVATFKRWMGEDREAELGDERFTAPQLSALVLRALKADAEAFLGAPVTEAVITVPAYFNENQRRATRNAGELAGLDVRRVLNEPTAAALSYGYHRKDVAETLVVFDLGGGTFDVTVLEIFEGTVEILSTAGESRLGGEDFTAALVSHVLERKGLLLEQVEMEKPLLFARLKSEAEAAKLKLSEHATAELRFPDAEGNVGPDAERVQVGAAELESLSKGLVERLRVPLERALRDARKSFASIDDVLLVGGATRMPLVRALTSDLFGREPRTDVDPDLAVALGAAVQTALIEDDAAVEDLVMTDVCPFTLGIDITKEFGTRKVDGYALPVIHRNTTIPVSREERVCTLHPNQREMHIGIYQGEARRAEDNLKLGELRVEGLPPGPRGLEVCVRFTYDLNGLLEVEAYVPSTKAKFHTVLTHHVKGLDEKEVRAAHQRMQKLKFYPREKLVNRSLLHFAEGVVKEVDRFHRDQLEEAIDAFELALDAADVGLFTAARDQLLRCLSALGFPYRKNELEEDDAG